jgi:hypothetical protein
MGVAYGSTGSTVCVGNDSRLSDARTPVAHNQAWSTITTTPTTISGYGLTDAASTGANTFTGAQLIRAAATQDAIKILGRAGGTSSYAVTITPLALSANRTLSAPDADGTIATLGEQTFTGNQTITGSLTCSNTIAGVYNILNLRNLDDGATSFTQFMFGNDTSAAAAFFGVASSAYISLGGANSLNLGTAIASPVAICTNSVVRLTISSTGVVSVADTTEATDKDTGSIVTEGGIGVEKSIVAGGSINIASGQGYKVAGTKVVGGQASAIADVSTADATDLTSAIALANANKAKINTTLAMLRTHGLIAT